MPNTKKYQSLPYNPNLVTRARELRKAGNLSEVLLWKQLRNRGFRGLHFNRQKIIGNYIVDFFCRNCGVVIEVDGVSHDEKGAYDAKRDAYFKGLGLKVIHIQAADILHNLNGVMLMLRHHPALRE